MEALKCMVSKYGIEQYNYIPETFVLPRCGLLYVE